MPGSILAMAYDSSTGRLIAQLLTGTQIQDYTITAGKLASGAVIAGRIGSGAIDSLNLMVDGLFTADATGRAKFADSFIVSAKIGALAVGTPHIAAGAILSGLVGANVLATPHLANQGILSASIGPNALATPHLANQGILSASIGANAMATPHIQNQGILSASFGAGAIGAAHVADFGLVSGKYASGSITEGSLASGISIDIAETLAESTFRAGGIVSAYECVAIMGNTLAKYLLGARANDETRMPSLGFVGASAASGALATILLFGRAGYDAGRVSGKIGDDVFIGTDGYLVTSGGATFPSSSGNISQRMGEVVADNTVDLKPSPIFVSVAE
ncbi:MAG: hypothetical protein ABIH46_02440 [Chloroflexota bacterium]